MATRRTPTRGPRTSTSATDEPVPPTPVSASFEELLLAAMDGDGSLETGRFIVTHKEGATEDAAAAFRARGLKIADAREFEGQSVATEGLAGSDGLIFPEIGCAIIGGEAAASAELEALVAEATSLDIVEPELFVFPEGEVGEYLRGFLRATETIAQDLGVAGSTTEEPEEDAQVLGATWGLSACRVPRSVQSGLGIKVAVLDTGMDLGHPDFAGRAIVTHSFIPGQPVQDLHSHGTHCIGTACGPKSPPGNTPRYGVAWRGTIFVGKVLSNSGGSVSGSVLAGMNWAIANRCEVISMSLGSPTGPQAYYTAAGNAALSKGCLMIAAAGNVQGGQTGAPANSPTIMSVASLDRNLAPSSFSSRGKVEIAAPGRDVYSSVPRPVRYGTKSGTSMATPHVAGCAALWAELRPSLRGLALWRQLQASARPLPFPPGRVGKGLVQAP